jgi:ribosomal-protein-alanine N-acetyltransferase
LSALDLAQAVLRGGGVAAGLPESGTLDPLYVRPAQAEEKVRRKALAGIPLVIRDFGPDDIAAAAAIEQRVFTDPWPASFFAGELAQPLAYARVAERGAEAGSPLDPSRPANALAGYLLAWLGDEEGHLGNLAVSPEHRRAGVARALLEDLLAVARERGTSTILLEVRVSNFAAQALYRDHGFRLAGLRRGYYRDTGEDALLMTWRRDGARSA